MEDVLGDLPPVTTYTQRESMEYFCPPRSLPAAWLRRAVPDGQARALLSGRAAACAAWLWYGSAFT